MPQMIHQTEFRPALLDVIGCKEYREERDLFVRIDKILTLSGLEKNTPERYETVKIIALPFLSTLERLRNSIFTTT